MKKLLCIIVDGLRSETLACAHAGFLENISRRGVVCRDVICGMPQTTMSALYTVLTSLWPHQHGVTDNRSPNEDTPMELSLASLCRYRQRTISLLYSRDGIASLIPPRMLDNSLFINSQGIRNVDKLLIRAAGEHLQSEKPDCCFLYLDGVDIATNHFGFLSECSFEAIETVDRGIAHIFEQIRKVGLDNEYVLMVLGGQGGWKYCNKNSEAHKTKIPLFILGPDIAEGMDIDMGPSLLDLAPTMADILGVSLHPDWQGRVLQEIFARNAPSECTQSLPCPPGLVRQENIQPAV